MISRQTLAAIHIAKKDRGLDDDSYRDMLERVAKVRSAADLDDKAARLVLVEFERLGYVARPPTSPRKTFDRRPIANKARALWIGLHQLDEIDTGTDRALAAFVRRVTGKDAVAFCTNGDLGKVVEALKAWLARVGASADDNHAKLDPQRALVREQGRRLLDHRRHGDVGELGSLVSQIRQAGQLDGPHLNVLAGQLGVHVRRLRLGARRRPPLSTTRSSNMPSPISAGRLKSFVERIEKLEEERKAIGGDIKDVYSEAKGVGYDVKTMRKIIALRAMDAADRAEADTLLDVYKHALGML